jgi:hypothetical protein
MPPLHQPPVDFLHRPAQVGRKLVGKHFAVEEPLVRVRQGRRRARERQVGKEGEQVRVGGVVCGRAERVLGRERDGRRVQHVVPGRLGIEEPPEDAVLAQSRMQQSPVQERGEHASSARDQRGVFFRLGRVGRRDGVGREGVFWRQGRHDEAWVQGCERLPERDKVGITPAHFAALGEVTVSMAEFLRRIHAQGGSPRSGYSRRCKECWHPRWS